MTSQCLMPARNAGLSSHRPGNFDSGHFELFDFPGWWLLRPAFLAGIKPCDVIVHKVYYNSQHSFGRISGGSLRADQSEIRPANILCFFVFLSRLSNAKFLLAGEPLWLTGRILINNGNMATLDGSALVQHCSRKFWFCEFLWSVFRRHVTVDFTKLWPQMFRTLLRSSQVRCEVQTVHNEIHKPICKRRIWLAYFTSGTNQGLCLQIGLWIPIWTSKLRNEVRNICGQRFNTINII
jgi:hypothetical protein